MDGKNDPEVSHPQPGVAVVECAGEHDMTTKDETAVLLSALIAENDLVIVDVSDARFIDSSFVNNLLRADRLARDRGSRFRLQVATAPIVRRVLEISGILDKLDIATTRDEALRPWTPDTRPARG
jgi:anti-anti-sigma factor